MLYALYDWQKTALEPLRLMAIAGQQFYGNPILPAFDTRYSRAMAATCELVERSIRRYGKPPFGLDKTTIGGKTVAVEEQVVLCKPFADLLHFRRKAKTDDPKVLLVAPMSGHYATLLRGTVAALLPDHEVYITDWIDAREVPRLRGDFGLDDYIEYVIEYLEYLGPNTNVIAVCQPSVPVMASVAIMAAEKNPARPATMTLMGGPIDTRINPTQVNEFATSHSLGWFENSVINRVPFGYAGAGRRVYPGFMQLSGFMSMNMDRHFGAHLKLFEHLIVGDDDSAEGHRRFYDEYMSVMDMTAEFYLETIETVFQKHALPEGTWTSRGRIIDPSKIKDVALLIVEGELDDISAVGQTKAAHDLCDKLPAKKRKHYEQPGVGHYGIFNGRKWREKIYPIVKDFIRTHARD